MVSERLALLYCTACSLGLHAALGFYASTIPLAGPGRLEAFEVSLVASVPGTKAEADAAEHFAAGADPVDRRKAESATASPSRVARATPLSAPPDRAPNRRDRPSSTGSDLAPLARPAPQPAKDILEIDLPEGIHEPNPTSPNLGPADVRAVSRSRRPADGMAPGDTHSKGALSGVPLEQGTSTGDGQGDEAVARLTFKETPHGPLSPASAAARASIVEGQKLPKRMLPVKLERREGQPAQRGAPDGRREIESSIEAPGTSGAPGPAAAQTIAAPALPAGSNPPDGPAMMSTSPAIPAAPTATPPEIAKRAASGSTPSATSAPTPAPRPAGTAVAAATVPARQAKTPGPGSLAPGAARAPLELEDVILVGTTPERQPAPAAIDGVTAGSGRETAAAPSGSGKGPEVVAGAPAERRTAESIWVKPSSTASREQKPVRTATLGAGKDRQDRATRAHTARVPGMELTPGNPGLHARDQAGAVRGSHSSGMVEDKPEGPGALPTGAPGQTPDTVRAVLEHQSPDRYDLARQLQAHLPARLAAQSQQAAESTPPTPPGDAIVGQVAGAAQPGTGQTGLTGGGGTKEAGPGQSASPTSVIESRQGLASSQQTGASAMEGRSAKGDAQPSPAPGAAARAEPARPDRSEPAPRAAAPDRAEAVALNRPAPVPPASAPEREEAVALNRPAPSPPASAPDRPEAAALNPPVPIPPPPAPDRAEAAAQNRPTAVSPTSVPSSAEVATSTTIRQPAPPSSLSVASTSMQTTAVTPTSATPSSPTASPSAVPTGASPASTSAPPTPPAPSPAGTVGPPAALGRTDGVALEAEPTRTPGILPPGQEGGGPVAPKTPGLGGAARSGERARAVHSADMQSFLSRAGIDPNSVDPGEILDVDARESTYFDYLLKVRRAIDHEFARHNEAETGLLRGKVELVFVVDRKGRIRRDEIMVSFNPGKPILVDIARDTVARADLPRIPSAYGRDWLVLRATFRFGMTSDELVAPGHPKK